jgi:Fe-S-cluster containining protein
MKQGPVAFLQRIKRQPPRDLDAVMHSLHDKVFAKTNCLTCANCCKTTGPLWTERDKDRVARRLGQKTIDFEANYLRLDEDGDWVLKQLPCPFLEADNACSIYEDRPKACREYPHTDRVKQVQILDVTAKNVLVCPAVGEIVQRMEAIYAEKSATPGGRGTAGATPAPRRGRRR